MFCHPFDQELEPGLAAVGIVVLCRQLVGPTIFLKTPLGCCFLVSPPCSLNYFSRALPTIFWFSSFFCF